MFKVILLYKAHSSQHREWEIVTVLMNIKWYVVPSQNKICMLMTAKLKSLFTIPPGWQTHSPTLNFCLNFQIINSFWAWHGQAEYLVSPSSLACMFSSLFSSIPQSNSFLHCINWGSLEGQNQCNEYIYSYFKIVTTADHTLHMWTHLLLFPWG